MIKKDQQYHLGLDIGTNSIGFVAKYDDGSLVKARSKTIIGSRLFQNGETAESRRLARTTRRRFKRRKFRIRLLNSIFDEPLNKIDPNFLMRLKDSNLLPKDKNSEFRGALLFPEGGDGQFRRDYPTIYHLRYKLINSREKFDLRMIYLAMHHIIKYRGNFLTPLPISSFIDDDKTISDYILELRNKYKQLVGIDIIDTSNLNEINNILTKTDTTSSDKQKSVSKLLNTSNENKTLNKRITKINAAIGKAIVGNKTELNVFLDPNNDSELDETKVYLSDENFDDEISDLLPQLNSDQHEILDIVRQLFSKVSLSQIATDDEGISKSMINKYNQHKAHLSMYKEMIDGMKDSDKKQKLRDAYSSYVHNKDLKKVDLDTFYNEVKKNIDLKYKNSETIIDLIKTGNFMPKQRTFANGVIPHQLHQIEMQKIIDNQKKYYPWLGEPNPNLNRKNQAKYKIEELVAFHIPYYVGPLITRKDQIATSGKQFAWMERKESGEITPWNFENKVDIVESANNFIKRMTKKDSYLLNEDVLPNESLLYERYKVLSEINMVRVNGRHLTFEMKRDVFNDLFKNSKTVNVNQFINYLFANNFVITKNPKIEGLSNPKKFNNGLGTFIDMKKIFGEEIDNPDLQDKLEEIIEWSTVFEDRNIFKTKLLRDAKWLNEQQRHQLVKKRYSGWGRLSKKLLSGLKNEDGESIIDVLWTKNVNLMQVITSPYFKSLIDEYNYDNLNSMIDRNDDEWVEALLQDAYTSPQNKKAIRQVIKVVDDIKKAMHGVYPKSISIEFTREHDNSHKRTIDRLNQIENLYKSIPKEFLDSELIDELKNVGDSNQNITDKLYLYFTQLGRDMYVGDGNRMGKKINIDDLANYHIDHILPQAFIKDDSLNNRVLTNSSTNIRKSNNVPGKIFGNQMGSFWRLLNSKGLMSNFKLKNLTMDPENMNKYTIKGFINRQLVETSQVVKLVANIFSEKYPNSTIIEVPAKFNTQLRRDFKFIKNRYVNDYHHAFDAYLTAFVGTYFYDRYPKLRSYFVYGENEYTNEKDIHLDGFNFLHDLYVDDFSKMKDKKYTETVKKYNTLLTHQAREVYNYKFMLISHEIVTNNAAMFDETLYSPNDKKHRPSNLIPLKKNMPTVDYGGYSGNKDAYMAIIKIIGKSKNTYRVVGVKRRWSDSLNRALKDSNDKYINLLRSYLKEEDYIKKGSKNKKTGEITVSYQSFEILCPKVYYYQLIEDRNNKFLLSSSRYRRNGRQLVLSNKTIETLDLRTMKKLYIDLNDNNELSNRYNDAYREIVDKSVRYFPVFDIGKFNDKLSNGYNEFEKLANLDKLQVLNMILDGLHDNGTRHSINQLNINDLGKISSRSGINLSKGSKVCFVSPTGLFVKKIQLD